MNILHKELLAYKEMQHRFPRSQKLYDKGLHIFITYGGKNNLRRRLSRGQANPQTKHWGHLEHQLNKLGLKEVKPPIKQYASNEARKKVTKSTFEAPIHVPMQAPESLSDDLEVLINQNRQLAQNRAILANKLHPEEHGGHTLKIEKNKNLVEEILDIVAQQQPIETKIEELKKLENEKPKDDNPVIFEDAKIGYFRLNDLYEMTIPDLGSLKHRLNIKYNNYVNRIDTYKKATSKVSAKKKMKQITHATSVIERVIADLKIAQNA